MNLPRALPKRLWAPGFVLLLVSGVVSSLIDAEQPLVQTATSYGGPPYAWGAAYDLLRELRVGATRARARLATRDLAQTQWIIEPGWSDRDLLREITSIEQFVAAGGTVVVIGAYHSVWRSLSLASVEPHEEERAGHDKSDRAPSAARHGTQAGAQTEAHTPREAVTVHGPWLRGVRHLELFSTRLFDANASAGSEPRVQTDQGAFVIERHIGAGKLVAVADSRFLSNGQLDQHQHAPFLLDLALAYGAPAFDERCHGLLPPRSPWTALGRGFLWLVALALAALTLAALQHARRWPAPGRSDDAPPAPTLEVFVSSLASLYRARGRRTPANVFRAYRLGFLRRVQRALFGHRELSQARFEGRMESEARRLGPAGRWLSGAAAPASPAELTSAVSALERYAASVTETKRKR